MSVPSLFPIAISLNSEIGKLFLEIEPWSRSKPVPVAGPLGQAGRWRGRDVRHRRGPGLARPRPLLPSPLDLALLRTRAHRVVRALGARPGGGAGAQSCVDGLTRWAPRLGSALCRCPFPRRRATRCFASAASGSTRSAGSAAPPRSPSELTPRPRTPRLPLAVNDLEKSCRNASYAASFRCVQSLQKVKPFSC